MGRGFSVAFTGVLKREEFSDQRPALDCGSSYHRRIPLMFSERTNWKLAQNRFTKALEEVRARGAKVLDLTVSNLTRAGLHYEEQAILGALASPRALDYDPQSSG